LKATLSKQRKRHRPPYYGFLGARLKINGEIAMQLSSAGEVGRVSCWDAESDRYMVCTCGTEERRMGNIQYAIGRPLRRKAERTAVVACKARNDQGARRDRDRLITFEIYCWKIHTADWEACGCFDALTLKQGKCMVSVGGKMGSGSGV
jgi:hypothetical protein